MKEYVKPETLRIDLQNNICGGGGGGDEGSSSSGNSGNGKICGVTTTFNVSKKERKSYEFCYHYPTSGNGSKQNPYKYSAYTGVVICVKPGQGITFIEEGNITDYGDGYKGWADFKGDNGTCHFCGRVSINGVEVTKDNVGSYKCSN